MSPIASRPSISSARSCRIDHAARKAAADADDRHAAFIAHEVASTLATSAPAIAPPQRRPSNVNLEIVASALAEAAGAARFRPPSRSARKLQEERPTTGQSLRVGR